MKRGLGLLSATALLAGVAVPARAAGAAGVSVTDMTPSFPSGTYVALAVDPRDSARVAVTTADGRVAWTDDAGASGGDARVVARREYVSAPLRSQGRLFSLLPAPLHERATIAGLKGEPPGSRLFLWLLKEGRPVARWQYWMAVENPAVTVFDATVPAPGQAALAATASGLYLSDRRRASWIEVAGAPAPRGQDLAVYSVTVDPDDARRVLAGTSHGLLVSRDGGRSFTPHADPELADVDFRRFYWDPAGGGHVLALAARAVYQSYDAGAGFERSFASNDGINAVALGDDGVYVATGQGLITPGQKQRLFAGERVVGVVPLGGGACLAASEAALHLRASDGEVRMLMRADADGGFLRLEGDGDAAWALTRHGVFQVTGQSLARSAPVAAPPRISLSPVEVERAVIAHLGLGGPADTRLGKPWVAQLAPRVVVGARSAVSHAFSSTFDATLPFPERLRTSSGEWFCCGVFDRPVATGGPPELVVMLTWDLAALLTPYRAPTYPYSIIEMNLRAAREQILPEVRWRYGQAARLAALLARPPDDPQTLFLWRSRLAEHAAYLEAMTGRSVVAVDPTNPDEE